jgi:16S rRNA (cytosine1402-N4)-methyltransferase
MEALALKPGGKYVDATFGGGGYSREMLAHADCQVIAFDRDPDAIAPPNFRSQRKVNSRFIKAGLAI